MTFKWNLKSLINYITVEPIIFCNYFALALFRAAEHAGIYHVICVQEYQDLYNMDCRDLKRYPHVEDLVQKRASTINMYLSLAYLLPAIVSDIFLGAYSDRNGRQFNIMLGLAGLTLTSFPLILILEYPHLPLWILILAHVICGMTGYIAIVIVSSLAYLVDIVPDTGQLTVRMSRVYVFNALATTLGSLGAGALMKVAPLPYTVLANEVVLSLAFFYTLCHIKQKSPLRHKISEPKKKGGNFLPYILQLYKEVGQTFSKKRPDRQRLHLHIISLVFFVFMIADLGLLHGPVLSLYTFHRPLYWTPSELSYWKAAQSAVLALGLLLGSWLMKNIFHWRDFTVLLVSLTSAFGQLILLAFSSSTWMMYLTILLSVMSNITLPTVKSITAQIVGKQEVGKAYAMNSVAADMAYVGATLMFNNIYKDTVDSFAGGVFIFSASLTMLCIIMVLYLHIDYRYLIKPKRIGNVEPPVTTVTKF